MSPRTAVVSLALLSSACSGPDPESAFKTTPTDPASEVVDTLPNGLYAMSFGVSAVGGLAVPFQLDVQTMSGGLGGSDPRFERFDLRAVAADGSLSEILVSTSGDPVSEDGFSVDLGEFVLPGAYSVTGSDVTIAAVLEGQSASQSSLCGELTGQLVTFGIDLAGSTFGAVPWDDREGGVPTSCDTGTVEEIPRLEVCPAITDGLNTGFVSGAVPRDFEVVLPSDYDSAQSYPLIFVYHGFGGTIASMLDEAQLRPYADSQRVILVVPQGEDIGGQDGWDAFSDPLTNLDLVLFDDMLHCAQETFSVDPDRIYVTGMSNGGLFTGYLLATRASVFAAAAPMSGGMGIASTDAATPPVLGLWGGESDLAFDQDFNLLTTGMLNTLVLQGNFAIGCNHELGHTLDPAFWPWVLQFLAEHPKGISPEPYAAGLPESFPDYCAIWP